jgi:N utilization substance protein B
MSRKPDRAARARSVARKFALQALYQHQLTAHAFGELRRQYQGEEGFEGCDAEYFAELLRGVTGQAAELDARLAGFADRAIDRLDPIERAVLWIGLYELTARLEIPYRVVINEAVELAKRFGATDGHRYVNAVLDRAARELRPQERASTARAGRSAG